MKKKILHRDLATRNVLINLEGEKSIVKISDFGLSRETNSSYYSIENSKNVPIRWTAPEVYEFSKYFQASDVWSYGVTCWEIMMDGKKPYSSYTNETVLLKVTGGEILSQESCIPNGIYEILKKCWNKDHRNRPDFETLVVDLKLYLKLKEREEDLPSLQANKKSDLSYMTFQDVVSFLYKNKKLEQDDDTSDQNNKLKLLIKKK